MNEFQMVPVNSSHIAAVGYDKDSGALYIQFKGGRTYNWLGVTEGDYQNLISAESPGRYLRNEIEARYGKGMPSL